MSKPKLLSQQRHPLVRGIPTALVIVLERGLDFTGWTSMGIAVVLWAVAAALAVVFFWPWIRSLRLRSPIYLSAGGRKPDPKDSQDESSPPGERESPNQRGLSLSAGQWRLAPVQDWHGEEAKQRYRQHCQEVQKIRDKNGVRPLNDFEEGRNIADLPSGVRGEIHSSSLENGHTASLASTGMPWPLEVHKTKVGAVIVIGYVSQQDQLTLSRADRTGDISLFTKYTPAANSLVEVPIERIVNAEGHRLPDHGERVDLRLKPYVPAEEEQRDQ